MRRSYSLRLAVVAAIIAAAASSLSAEPPKPPAPATAAVAADDVGIAVGRSFAVPLLIGSKDAANIAFVERVNDKTQLRVVYVRQDGTLGFVVYSITRQDGPGPDPKPDPRPDPKPDPKPDPLPIPTVLWGIVVEESSTRTADQAAVIASPKTRAAFDANNFRVVDKDLVVSPDLKPYVERAAKQALPVLFVVDDKGKVYFEGPLPANIPDLEALVAKLRKGTK
jgi:hypothetical protein